MFDIWAFLLQTLTVSGTALLILFIKALFKDKLTPKWQFAVWGVLGLVMLMPAGIGGRYTLFRWQLAVEIVKFWFGDYSLTKVYFPIPVIISIPKTIVEWVFVIYVLGVIAHLLKYAISYFKLRRVVKMGKTPHVVRHCRIQRLEKEQGLKLYKVVEVDGLPSAFVYGVFRPVLVLPTCDELDEKIVLHELFHMKNKDTLWSVIICVLRSLHWCNPLIIYCANRALNDMESRCDQYVLENLEGEERREYGHILLSMANEKYSKTPGTTCINNGGKNIRARIENIARFKKYPQGMGLVSVCVIILLAFQLLIGMQSSAYEFDGSVSMNLASARSTPCTTLAGAFDAYGKAVLTQNGYYRAMCAPVDMQEDILNEMIENKKKGIYPLWNSGLEEFANSQSGYFVYNLTQIENNAYEGVLVVDLIYPPDGKPAEENMKYLALQTLRVEKHSGRWVAIPLEDFKYVESRTQTLMLAWGCEELPGVPYVSEAYEIKTELMYQTVHTVDSKVTTVLVGGAFYYDTTPDPNAEFTAASRSFHISYTHLGSSGDKRRVNRIGLTTMPVYEGGERPKELLVPSGDVNRYSSYTGEQWVSTKVIDWEDSTLYVDGGGGSIDPKAKVKWPQYFAADLYINDKKVAELDLTLSEEGSK